MKRGIGWAEVFLGLFFLCFVGFGGTDCLANEGWLSHVTDILLSGGVFFFCLHIVFGILRPSGLSTPTFPAFRGLASLAYVLLYAILDHDPYLDGEYTELLMWGVQLLPLAYPLLGLVENIRARKRTTHRRWLPLLNSIVYAAMLLCVPMAWGVIMLKYHYADMPQMMTAIMTLNASLLIEITILLPLAGIAEILKGVFACRIVQQPDQAMEPVQQQEIA